ncbi:uncharacterized protein LOC131641788 [Vicia villosa]|nr:uncharacterized protein LOC131641788 [Vicia villosa]
MANTARSRSVQLLWVACHERIPTKARLVRLGLLDNSACVFCSEVETMEHLLFSCHATRTVWEHILKWLVVDHRSDSWNSEIAWMNRQCKKKGNKSRILLCAFTETIYECWWYRNQACFGEKPSEMTVVSRIIDATVYRCWAKPKLRTTLSRILMP